MGYDEHAEEARNLLRWVSEADAGRADLESSEFSDTIAVAQVHATLAVAAAIREARPPVRVTTRAGQWIGGAE